MLLRARADPTEVSNYFDRHSALLSSTLRGIPSEWRPDRTSGKLREGQRCCRTCQYIPFYQRISRCQEGISPYAQITCKIKYSQRKQSFLQVQEGLSLLITQH